MTLNKYICNRFIIHTIYVYNYKDVNTSFLSGSGTVGGAAGSGIIGGTAGAGVRLGGTSGSNR